MTIKLYNTLTGKKENLARPPKTLRLFVCGPTVYDLSHIGHARTYIFFDILARYLKGQGYKIFYLQNITDIDDKIIARAKKEGISPIELGNKFTREHERDMKALGITAVSKYAPATKFIPQIVSQVQTLIRKGYAYEIPGDGYYYDIKKFKDYGRLSRRTAEQAEDAVSRIDQSVNKRNAGDFCLWKFSKPGEPFWKTKLGKGRPGWHIEDTAIAEYYFGPQYELHGGGVDLKFPHHEAEIAQAEAFSGKKPFVKIWMHVGMLTVEGQKMSKSLGNFITIKDFLKKHSPSTLRLLILGHDYKSPLDYSDKLIRDSHNALETLGEFMEKLNLLLKHGRPKAKSIKVNLEKYNRRFIKAMNDDLNTPQALAAIFELINSHNKTVWNLTKKDAELIKKWLRDKLLILGIEIIGAKIPSNISALVKSREALRTNKQFIKADALRKKILELGYKVEDTPVGPLILKKS